MIGIHVPWSSHLSWMGFAEKKGMVWDSIRGIAKNPMISWGNAHPQTWRKISHVFTTRNFRQRLRDAYAGWVLLRRVPVRLLRSFKKAFVLAFAQFFGRH